MLHFHVDSICLYIDLMSFAVNTVSVILMIHHLLQLTVYPDVIEDGAQLLKLETQHAGGNANAEVFVHVECTALKLLLGGECSSRNLEDLQ